MLDIIIRTVIIYATLMVAMRIMGKRQLGELEVSELITTLMLSEIAAGPISNPDIPIHHALVPIVLLILFEIVISAILLRTPKLRHLLSSKPTILISHGTLDAKELKKVRMSVEELISSLRLKDVTAVTQVEYAILENNGQLSVIKKNPNGPSGKMMYVIIADGKVCDSSLKKIMRNRTWLDEQLRTRKMRVKDVFCFMSDTEENLFIQKK